MMKRKAAERNKQEETMKMAAREAHFNKDASRQKKLGEVFGESNNPKNLNVTNKYFFC